MRRQLLQGILAVLMCGVAAVAADAPGADKEKIQGKWTVVSGREGGKALTADKVKGTQLVITADTMAVTEGDRKRVMTYKLDASQKPKTIDLTTTEGSDLGKTALGIYSLEGDNLRICFVPPGKERPRTFDTKADNKEMLFVMKRAK